MADDPLTSQDALDTALSEPSKRDLDMRFNRWAQGMLESPAARLPGGISAYQMVRDPASRESSAMLIGYHRTDARWSVWHYGKRNSDLWNACYHHAADVLRATSMAHDIDGLQAAVIARLARHTVVGRLPFWLRPADDAERHHEWLVFRNGALDMTRWLRDRTVDLRADPHRLLTLATLPFAFDPAAVCPRWSDALSRWHPDDPDVTAFLQEFVGYLFDPTARYEMGVVLDGEGSNGKSTFLTVLERMVGVENRSTLSLSDLGSKFRTIALMGMFFNRADETNPTRPLDVAAIKMLLSGNPQTFEHKYGHPFSAVTTAKLIVAWNTPPPIPESTHGLWRKIAVIPWHQRLSASQPGIVSGYADVLASECAGIFNWACDGLRRLRDRDGRGVPVWTQSRTIAAYTGFLRRHTDPVTAFINECCTISPCLRTPQPVVRNAYRVWCEQHGFPANVNTLWKRLMAWSRGRLVRGRAAPDITGRRVVFYDNLMVRLPDGTPADTDADAFYDGLGTHPSIVHGPETHHA